MAVNVQELFSKRKKNSFFEKKNYEWFHEKTFAFEEELQKSDIVLKYFIYIFLRKQPKKSVICDIYIYI